MVVEEVKSAVKEEVVTATIGAKVLESVRGLQTLVISEKAGIKDIQQAAALLTSCAELMKDCQ